MRLPPLAAAALVVLMPLAGCLDELVGGGCQGEYTVSDNLRVPDGSWVRQNLFHVSGGAADDIRITATAPGGHTEEARGMGRAELRVPDGDWTVAFHSNGARCGTLEGLRVDGTPPLVVGLEPFAEAPDGSYVLGQGATVTGHVGMRIVELRTGKVVGEAFPVRLRGLANGLHPYAVGAWDEAGNFQNVTVQVFVGTATDLPEGAYDFGVVAQYSNTLRLWDLSKKDQYLAIADARAEAGAQYLGEGHGITPDDPVVREVVEEVVTPGMNTMEAAMALYRYMADQLEYDETRLDTETLLVPRQVLLDTEDPDNADCDNPRAVPPPADCDGLVADGPGNDVRGGICRDLAATYVSLLRAAGIPARLVSGYVGGQVNGFHAWVEFYAGAVVGADGRPQSPWVPVDVSTIDGPYSVGTFLQSFGIQRPEYLTLREVPPRAEVEGWSSAMEASWQWPQDAETEPAVRFDKRVTVDEAIERLGALCIHEETFARIMVEPSAKDRTCTRPTYTALFDGIVRETTRTIDYGVVVDDAPRGTRVEAALAYPFEDDVQPDRVIYRFYGSAFTLDVSAGKGVAEFWPSGR